MLERHVFLRFGGSSYGRGLEAAISRLNGKGRSAFICRSSGQPVSNPSDLPYISVMNIYDKGFAPSEATIRYLDGDYVVVRPGSFVRCAVTGKPIPIDELMYWNVDRQEPYVDANAALEAFKRHGLSAN